MGLDARKPIWGGGGGGCKQQRHRPACMSMQSDQPLRFLDSIVSKTAKNEISTFKLVSVAVQAGLNLTLKETQKMGFLAARPI